MDVLIAVGVSMMLVGLALPAVMRVRGEARTLVCGSRLRALGVALSSYEHAHAMLPPLMPGYRSEACPGGIPHNGPPAVIFSPQAFLLAYLDVSDLYESINFEVGPCTNWLASPPHPALATVLSVRVNAFLCPEDGTLVGAIGGTNYRVNGGISAQTSVHIEAAGSGRGPFVYTAGVRTGDISDGTSRTATMAERLRGTGDDLDNSVVAPGHVRRDFSTWVGSDSQEYIRTPEGSVALCRISFPLGLTRYGDSRAGSLWVHMGELTTIYKHTQTPNPPFADCVQSWGGYGIAAARSAHDGGVNVLFADGHTAFAAESVALEVWRALGTRNGGELVD